MGKAAAAGRARRKDLWVEIAGLALLAFTVFAFISVFSQMYVAFGHTSENACGSFGRWLSTGLIDSVGIIATYAVLLMTAVVGVCVFFRIPVPRARVRLAAFFLLVVPALAVSEWSFSREPLLPSSDYRGGFFGEFLGGPLDRSLELWGTRIAIGLAFLVGVLLLTDLMISPFIRACLDAAGRGLVYAGRAVHALAGFVGRSWHAARDWMHERRHAAPAPRPAVAAPAAGPRRDPGLNGKNGHGTKTAIPVEKSVEPEPSAPAVASSSNGSGATKQKKAAAAQAADDDDDDAEDDDDEWEDDDEEDDDEEWEDDEEDEEDEEEEAEPEIAAPERPKRTILLNRGTPQKEKDTFEIKETQLSLDGVYSLPPLSLLDDPPPPASGATHEELDDVATKIEQTLSSFKIEARVENVLRGPVITQFEVSLAAGIKVHKIVSLADDLAMSLSARSVRVVAPIPGKSAVGIEVPNRTREIVTPKELLSSKEFRDKTAAIPLLLGKDAAGTPIIEDLTRMPHLLIAGSTGSGKSVCINSIIASMLMTRSPDELKLILVDPKMVELSTFEEIPHLLTPVITDMKKAPAALEWLCRKMDDRYQLFLKAEVKHIQGYNELGKKTIFERLSKKGSHEEAEAAPARLPYIVIIIDELADLMMTASKEVENSIIRLSQKSRAVGLHVIVATQRPSVDVITGLIKANLPCRISFQVAGRVDSRTIIDRNGAERLLGQGDMLFLPPGISQVVRAQATYFSDRELKKIVRALKRETPPQFSTEIETYLEGGAPGEAEEVDDELFDDAVRIILESQRGSVSLLQRRLGIGYTRASRLMDLMGEHGIVGAFKGSKAREVFISLEEWEAKRQEN